MVEFNRLKLSQVSFFNQEGYMVVPDVFVPADLDPLRDEIAAVVDRAAHELHESGDLDKVFGGEPFETRISRIHYHDQEAGEKILRVVKGRHGSSHAGPEMFRLIIHPKLLAAVADLIGDEIIGSSIYRIRPKVPGLEMGVVPCHQDSGYFQSHCDREMIVTCWIPLVPATIENGCLQVIPRLHKKDLMQHRNTGRFGYLVIDDDSLHEAEPVTVPVPLGGALFLTNRTPHCSTENLTDYVRWSIDLRYQSALVPNNVGQAPQDYSWDRDEHEIACHPPGADFVVRSRTHPEREVRTPEDFDRVRRPYETFTVKTPPIRWDNA